MPESFPAIVLALGTPHLAITIASVDSISEPPLVTSADAADRLNVSSRTLSRLVADGKVRVVGRRVIAASVDALVGPAPSGGPFFPTGGRGS